MNKKLILIILMSVILVVISSCVGRYPLSLIDIYQILTNTHTSATASALFYNIRLSRTVLVFLCGGALSLSGMVYQTVFRNPLVSPDVLGVANGCSVGAAAAVVFLGGNLFYKGTLTFVSGIFVVVMAVLLSGMMPGSRLLAMIISGIVMGAIASSLLMLLKIAADPARQLPVIEFWLMGGFYNAKWTDVRLAAPVIIFASTMLFVLRWNLNVLTLGDSEAQSLGIPVLLVRFAAIAFATVLVSSVVSVAGVVSWIGLTAPHIVRIFIGESIMENFFPSFFMGSILLLTADILSRTLFAAELPISILTSLMGAVFLLVLLFKNRLLKGRL